MNKNAVNYQMRKLARKILGAIAEAYGNPDMFDGSEEVCEPDDSWFMYEDLIIDVLSKETKKWPKKN